MDFKIGDKVICIDNNDSDGKLTIGKKYTVIKTQYKIFNDTLIRITDDKGDGGGWFVNRFRKVEITNWREFIEEER